MLKLKLTLVEEGRETTVSHDVTIDTLAETAEAMGYFLVDTYTALADEPKYEPVK